jgi:predicted dehydrogenase
LIGKRHTQHVLDEPETKLACIVDPTPAGQDFAGKLGVNNYPSLDALLEARQSNKVKVDAAIIGTPNHTHVSAAIPLIQNGISVLVEKPIATDSTSAIELVKMGRQVRQQGSSAQILVGHHRRFNPYIRAAKHAISTSILGKIIAFQGTWALLKPLDYFDIEWRRQAGTGGPLLLNMIHEIDNLRYLFGDIIRVYVESGPSTRGFAVEETAAMTLRFNSGAVGTFTLSDAVASPYNWEAATGENPTIPKAGQSVYTIFGTKGSLALPELRLWKYAEGQESWLNVMQCDDSLKKLVGDVPPFTRQLKHLVDVQRDITQPNCSGLEGLKNLLVLEGMVKSVKTGQPVDIDVEID